ncbi:HAMP domain-containing sensor histidine kinase [Sulfurimonas sp. HSL-1716]|uniref:sensor histidine kinase n=1 Tax=Hydrocurvibacter sulfurireducens TaxID=3131937 RepID=UPI0031F751EC
MDFNNFLTSGLSFDKNERKIQNRYSMVNISFILSSLAIMYAAVHNYLVKELTLLYIEIGIVSFNIMLFSLLRIKREYFEYITTILCFEYLIFFNFLILFNPPSELRHIWIFTYPVVLLYFKDKNGVYWLSAFIAVMFILKIQSFVATYYTLYQISYLALGLIVISIILQLYRKKIDEDEATIQKQNKELENFSLKLQNEVNQKTKELLEINQNLEKQVEQKVNELLKKDTILVAQSRQAAMGEMISMIAHQWRQPLSNITLQISNLQISSILNEVTTKEILDKLENISNTIIYLSETIDDFQTYFQPNKEKETIDICKIVKRAVTFTLPRALAKDISIDFYCQNNITVQTHTNELVQVLINIINNAIDATMLKNPADPVVNINIDQCDGDESVYIYIKDNAGGVSEDLKEKIFEPYFSTKGKNGTGIGLYMSKMIVENHLGGAIDVSNIGGGARFRLKLPIN